MAVGELPGDDRGEQQWRQEQRPRAKKTTSARDVCKTGEGNGGRWGRYLRCSYLSSPDRKSPATDNNKVEVTLFRDMRSLKNGSKWMRVETKARMEPETRSVRQCNKPRGFYKKKRYSLGMSRSPSRERLLTWRRRSAAVRETADTKFAECVT